MSILTTHETKPNQKISKAIDKVLKQIFGDEATLLVYKYLESHYSLSQDEIFEKIEVFSQGLRELLKSGAHVVEMKILKDIYPDYGLDYEPQLKEVTRQDFFVSQIKILCLSKNENHY
jgi:hypothetical protein